MGLHLVAGCEGAYAAFVPVGNVLLFQRDGFWTIALGRATQDRLDRPWRCLMIAGNFVLTFKRKNPPERRGFSFELGCGRTHHSLFASSSGKNCTTGRCRENRQASESTLPADASEACQRPRMRTVAAVNRYSSKIERGAPKFPSSNEENPAGENAKAHLRFRSAALQPASGCSPVRSRL